MQLNEIKVGEVGFLSHFSDDNLAIKLLAMGFLPGAKIELVRKVISGKTYYIKVNGYPLALRENEVKCIVLK